jgi:hypothetical protein
LPLPCHRIETDSVLVSLADVLDREIPRQELEVSIVGAGADATSFRGVHIEDELFHGMKSQVQGVSHPRCGHHMLGGALVGYFGCRFRYCEQFTTCQQRPCIDPHTTLQKDHDAFFMIPVDDPRDYLIQYRHPLYSTPSHYEYDFRDGTYRGAPESRAAWLNYAVQDVERWKIWMTKWVINNNNPRAFYMSYEAVMRDPTAELTRVIGFLCPGHVVDELRLGKVVTNMRRHTPRKLSAFKYYDAGFFRELQQRAGKEIDAVGLERVALDAQVPRGTRAA